MELTIRPQAAGDCEELTALEREIFDCEIVSLLSFRRFVTSPSIASFVVRHDTRLVGYATVFFRARSRVARVYSIGILPDYRCHGLGQKLLDTCERAARQRGCQFLRLEVKIDNPRAAAFYQKHGFVHYGSRESYYEDGSTALLLRKPLQ